MNKKTFLILISFLFSTQAYAGLGVFSSLAKAEYQINIDISALCKIQCGDIKVASFAGYRAYEMSYQGFTVREYVAPLIKEGTQHVIFAVAWDNGLKNPDFSIILGKYFDEFQNSEMKRAKVHGRSSMILETKNLRVLRGGHASGGLAGSVIAKELLEQISLDLKVEDIK